ncbi:MAG TPA: hypothetical protein VM120_10110 [Bryobacteraceae bacterium]|nr:hypothetical protein [Bryobacteraceae bacterium]
MSFIAEALAGKKIDSVLVDSELTYIMLSDGTQITVRGVMLVEPTPGEVQRR